MNIYSSEELVSYVNKGHSVKYIFFWGHQKPKNGVSKTCFSQWYESPFTLDGVTYPTAEHFMMGEKAKLFSDDDAFIKVINANEPGKAKRIGREIKNFNEDIWRKKRFEIVIKANLLKFEQNSKLMDFLLKTGNRVLVEASPVDSIWGVGVASDNPKIENPETWEGLNLLGFALMVVRSKLIKAYKKFQSTADSVIPPRSLRDFTDAIHEVSQCFWTPDAFLALKDKTEKTQLTH